MIEKNYLIIGGSSGIGRELAINLSRDKHIRVIVCARRKEKLNELLESLNSDSFVIPCDVTNYDSIENVFEIIREKDIKLDGMIYCAGVCYVKPLKVMKAGEIEETFKTNVFGFYEFCRLFQNVKHSNQGASIVGLSSYAAELQESGMSVYAMTKAAMNVQASVLSKEFERRKIRINTIMPAIVMSRMASDGNEWTEEQLEAIKEKQSYGAIPISQVIESIRFLLSERSSYISGQAIVINAGYK